LIVRRDWKVESHWNIFETKSIDPSIPKANVRSWSGIKRGTAISDHGLELKEVQLVSDHDLGIEKGRLNGRS
jgi:hypothetical protein